MDTAKRADTAPLNIHPDRKWFTSHVPTRRLGTDRQRSGLRHRRCWSCCAFPFYFTDPAFKEDCDALPTGWSRDLNASVLRTTNAPPGHPMVVGHSSTAPQTQPHILCYGHYDVPTRLIR